ncbi:MAG TPA: hypothetical protein VHM70_17325 [Polyangiaceae bacterium]|jgi:hypothetical protein|nr:hypothetical protein [Polyangiaceae bacterium]
MNARRLQCSLVMISLALSWARLAQAGKDSAAAEALFQEGRQLLEAGNTQQACPKFAESQRLEPAMGTLLGLALCHEQDGKYASAWAEFVEAQGQAEREGQKERAEFAQGKADALKPRLSTLRISVAPGALEIPKLEIYRDGTILGSGAYDVAVPIDGGEHSVRVMAPEYKTWETSVQIGSEKSQQVIEVPALERLPPPPPAEADPAADLGDSVSDPLQGRHSWSTLRWVGVGAMGAGVAALGVAGYFGWSAIDNKDKSGCDAGACSNAQGIQRWQDAQSDGRKATLFTLAGAALAGAGLTLFFVGNKDAHAEREHITLLAGPGALSVSGAF